jgi:hypothetical protein
VRRRLAATAALLVAIYAVSTGSVVAHTSKAGYDYHIGDAFLQDLGFPAGEQAMAENGDVVTLVGSGSFSANGKSADGGGTFSHHVAASDATITGTWVATRTISFQFYGCGVAEGAPLPPDFCGGLLKLAVTATPDAFPDVHLSATLWINCVVGTNVPASVVEGVRLNVPRIIHFNKPVLESGANIYIQQ